MLIACRIVLFGSIASVLSIPANLWAADFGWDGGAGDSFWNSTIVDGGVQTNWLGLSEDIPQFDDNIVFDNTSSAGPVTIDLAGNTQEIVSVAADGVSGTYTFENGALQINKTSGEAVLTRNGSSLVIDSDLDLNSASTLRLNVQSTGGKITVNGDISSSALSGTTTLMPTVVNSSLPAGVEINGVISDGSAQTALAVGFNGNLSHIGTVRISGDNTYSGSTRVYIGLLEFDSIANIGGGPNALGQPAVADSTIRIGTGAAGSSKTGGLRYIGAGHTSNRVIELAGKDNDTQRILADGTGALVLTGGIANPANGEILILGGDNADDNTIGGAIQGGNGSDVTSLRKEGDGKWILAGTSPTLDGVIVAADGHLVLTGEIGSTTTNAGSFIVNNAGEFTIDDGYLAVGNFSRSANGIFNFRSGTIRVTNATTTGVFASSLTIGSAGAGTLQLQNGSKVFDDVILSGTDDTLEIGGSGTWQFDNLDNSAGATLTASGATLQINGGTFTQRVDAGTTQVRSRITGSGGLTKQGAGTFELTYTGQHAYSGMTRIEAGRLRLVGGGGLADTSPLFIAAGAELDLVGAVGGDAFGPLTGEGTILTAAGMGPAVLSAGQTAEFSGSILGAGGFRKADSGTQILSGASTYTGTTQIDSGGGTLELVAGGSIVGTSGVTYGSNANLSISGGTLDTPGSIRPSANSAVFNLTSGLVKANAIDRTVNSAYLSQFNWTGGTVHLLSATEIDGITTAVNRPFADSLTLDNDMALIVDDTLTVTSLGTLNINGGSVTADDILTGGNINFNSGAIRMRSSQVLDAARLGALDVDAPLVAGKSLTIDGSATIAAPFVLAGGKFSATAVENLENVILGSGTLEITGSDLDVATGAIVDATSGMNVNVTSGALNVAEGGQFNAINATLEVSNGINNSGDVNLINTIVNGDLVNGASGAVALLGSNTFSDDLTLSDDSTLLIDLAGTGPGEFDMLSVSGDATLAGNLVVSLTNDFALAAGDSFEVVDVAGAIAGSFEGLEDGALIGTFGDVDLFIDYTASGASLLTAPAADVDFDNDGDVDGADFLAIQRTNPTLTAVWEAQYGSVGASAVAATGVPEPTAFVMALFTPAVLLTMARSRELGPRRSSPRTT